MGIFGAGSSGNCAISDVEGEAGRKGLNFLESLADAEIVTTQTPTMSRELFGYGKIGADRRRSERHGHIIEAWIGKPDGSSERDEVATLDLSKHGVAFQLTHELKVGTYQVLEISMGTQKLASHIVVKRCEPVGDGFWEVGAEFC